MVPPQVEYWRGADDHGHRYMVRDAVTVPHSKNEKAAPRQEKAVINYRTPNGSLTIERPSA